MSQADDTSAADQPQRARRFLALACARADIGELRAGIGACGPVAATDIRRPEIGLVMLRGRIGGDGAPFNLGEATVTRASVRLATGGVGHGHVLGREPEKARLCAIADALGQVAPFRAVLEETLVVPVMARVAREQAARAALTAATKVNFFTLVRGDD